MCASVIVYLLSPGMYTLRVDCTPSLHTLVYDLTKQVSSNGAVHLKKS